MPDKDTWYEITLAVEGLPVHRIRASYPSVDERLYPGWTMLKTDAGPIAALVRSDRALLIRRCDDPPPAPKPAQPSPATIAAAAARTTGGASATGGSTIAWTSG
jgi:hypothetical protein